MLNVQKYINENGIKKLEEELHITVKDYSDFILLDYSQIFSIKFNPVVDECRGIILQKDTWKVLCRSFDRFYNYGEDPNSDTFPIEQSKILEKIDGSLIRFWNHPELGWNAATRKMAFAEGDSSRGNKKFSDLIEEAVNSCIPGFAKRNKFDEQCTYCFELVGKDNRVVTPYDKTELYLLAVRNNETGNYIDINEETAKGFGVKFPKEYHFRNWKECLDTTTGFENLEEGFVACYKTTDREWRIKIKSPKYLEVAYLRNNGLLSIPRIIKLVMMREEGEYLSYFPEDMDVLSIWIDKREKLRDLIIADYEKYKTIETQKEFAICVCNLPYKHILFQMRKNNKTYDETMEEMLKKFQGEKANNGLIELLEDI